MDSTTRPAPTSIVLGKNWRRRPFGLSLESKMNALAAGELLAAREVDLAIFSGGRTAGPDRPSEAAAIAEFMQRHMRGVCLSEDSIILEAESIDTAANAENVGRVVRANGHADIVLLTTAAHLSNARRIFRHYGVEVRTCLASEEILQCRSRHHARFVRRYRRSWRCRLDRARETLRSGLLVVDPGGRMLRPLTTLLRGR